MPLAVYADVRQYDTIDAGSPGKTNSNANSRPSLYPLCPYERVVAATPGLSAWWPLGYVAKQQPGGSAYSFFTYGNAVGGATLLAAGSGSDTLVPGIVPGSRNKAVKLAGGRYLATQDYRVWPMAAESLMSVEFWINFQTIGSDDALVGEWDNSSNGWMLYSSSGDLRIYCTSNNLTASSIFVTNKTYHVVGVWGGSQPATADFVSRVYVNGVDVLHGNLVLSGSLLPTTANAHMQINAYGSSDGGGSGPHAFTMQHLAFYQRMLQPAEVMQHYQAGFARE